MTDEGPDTSVPEEVGPIGKPSQAEGNDDSPSEENSPQPTGKPSQAEGDSPDSTQV